MSKSSSRRRVAPIVCPSKVESLENRYFLAADFAAIGTLLDSRLTTVNSGLNNVDKTTALPVTNATLSSFSQKSSFITSFQNSLVATVKGLSGKTPAQIQAAVYEVLGPAGKNVLGDTDASGTIDANDVKVTKGTGDDIAISVDLASSAPTDAGATDFGLTLPGLPLSIDSGSPKVKNTLQFAYSDLTFGWAGTTAFFGPAAGGSPMNFKVTLDGVLQGGTISGKAGLLPFTAVASATTPAATVDAEFDLEVAANGSFSKQILAGTGAKVSLPIVSSVPVSSITLPEVKSTLAVDWAFSVTAPAAPDANGANAKLLGQRPTVNYNDVTLDLSSFIHSTVGPLIDDLEIATKPIQPILDVIDAPIPVVSSLSHDLGGPDITLHSLADAADKTGLLPANISAIIKLVDTIDQVVTVVKKLDQAASGGIVIGSFGFGTLDLRTITSGGSQTLDPVAVPGSTSGISKQVDSSGLADLLPSGVTGTGSAGMTVAFPVFDNPKLLVGTLLGQDAKLVEFHAFAKLDVGTSQSFPFGPASVAFDGALHVDVDVRLGYDTYGIRKFVDDGANNATDLLQGFYVDKDSHAKLSGSLNPSASLNIVVFSTGIEGDVDFGANLTMHDQQTENDGNTQLLRINDFSNGIFDTQGKITGSIDLFVKVGVKVPFVGFVGWEKDFVLASGTIFSWSSDRVANPFAPPSDLQLAYFDPDTGRLFLATGSFADDLHVGDRDTSGIEQQFTVSDAGADPDNPSGPHRVLVSAYGYSQTFSGVTAVNADESDDHSLSVDIGKGVNVPVSLSGGAYADHFTDAGNGNVTIQGNNGADFIKYSGSGDATIQGGDGNDQIYGGSGNNFIGGGNDDDSISVAAHIAGAVNPATGAPQQVLNILNGEEGNDTIVGGQGGYNYIAGGNGSDDLTAGNLGDLIYGDLIPGQRGGVAGNDSITAGAGNDSIYGGGGDDALFWTYSDGATAFQGQAGNDSVSFLGSNNADNFTIAVGKTPNQEGGVDVYATGISTDGKTGVLYTGVESLDLEGLGGADTINVPDLTATGLISLTIDTQDIAQHDNAVDNVTLASGGNTNHAINVFNEGVGTQQIDTKNADGRTIDTSYLYGGVTKVDGLAQYEIRVGNVGDSVVMNTGSGDDNVQVYGISGPTKIYTQAGNDTVAIAGQGPTQSLVDDPQNIPPDQAAQTSGPTFAGTLLLDAGTGANNKFAYGDFTPTGTKVTVSNYTFTSPLFPAGFTFVATGGKFGGGGEVDTGDGNDTVIVLSTMTDGHFIVYGGAGDDLTVVESTTAAGKSTLSTLGNAFGFDGQGGSNELRLDNSAGQKGDTNVQVNGQFIAGFGATKQLIGFASTGGTTLLHLLAQDNYTSTEQFFLNSPAANVRVDGQGGNDIVQVTADANAVSFNGGSGLDYLALGKKTSAGYVLSGVTGNVDFDGGDGKGDQIYIADDAGATARVYTMNANAIQFGTTLVTIKNDEERFLFGGKGGDRLVMTGLLPASTYAHWYGGAGSNDLTGSKFGSTFLFTGFQSGQLNKEVDFHNVATVHTGTGSNVLADSNGVNTGVQITSTGSDVLDYSLWKSGVTVDLSQSSATGFNHVFGIRGVIGSNYNDLIRGDLNANTLLGAGGNDILIGMEGLDRLDGMAGDDILIGGIGADSLNGGDGIDLLIDGTTTYDTNDAQLKLAMTQWATPPKGIPPKNRQLPAVFSGTGKLTHDSSVDTLTGGTGNDTFYVGVKSSRTQIATDYLNDLTAGDLVLT